MVDKIFVFPFVRRTVEEAAMVEKLSTDVWNKLKVEELKEEFRKYDVDQNGFITAAELRYVMSTKDGDRLVTDERVNNIIRLMDVDGDGRVSYDDFVSFAKMTPEEAAMVVKSEEMTDGTLENMMETFRVFDKDQNGFISAAELRQAMTKLGNTVTKEDVNDMIQEVDVDGDGQINFNEFVQFMNSLR